MALTLLAPRRSQQNMSADLVQRNTLIALLSAARAQRGRSIHQFHAASDDTIGNDG
jgi:hypothetical protein